MHRGDVYLGSIGKLAPHAVLSAAEAGALSSALRSDACNFFQCSLVSFVDSIRAIDAGFYTWAIVKLYYAVFYALRARLALDNERIFYQGRSPLTIAARPGAVTRKARGNTHELVLNRFRETQKGDYFLSQEVGGQDSLSWFICRREEANYTEPRFSEPSTPYYIESFTRHSTRKVSSAYADDRIYTFDPDHAAVAFPFALLSDLRGQLAANKLSPLMAEESTFLRNSLKDPSGPV